MERDSGMTSRKAVGSLILLAASACTTRPPAMPEPARLRPSDLPSLPASEAEAVTPAQEFAAANFMPAPLRAADRMEVHEMLPDPQYQSRALFDGGVVPGALFIGAGVPAIPWGAYWTVSDDSTFREAGPYVIAGGSVFVVTGILFIVLASVTVQDRVASLTPTCGGTCWTW